jgi:hypothetical protein
MDWLTHIKMLSRARTAEILDAKSVDGPSSDTGHFHRRCIAAHVPNWIAAKFEAANQSHKSETVHSGLTVMTTEDQLDAMLILAHQTGTTQVRCVMLASNPKVKQLVNDANANETVQLLFFREHAELATLFELNVKFAPDPELQNILRTAALTPLSAVMLVNMTLAQVAPNSLDSLIPGVDVHDVLVLTVGMDVDECMRQVVAVSLASDTPASELGAVKPSPSN